MGAEAGWHSGTGSPEETESQGGFGQQGSVLCRVREGLNLVDRRSLGFQWRRRTRSQIVKEFKSGQEVKTVYGRSFPDTCQRSEGKKWNGNLRE